MKLSDFDYNLPKNLIAQVPIKPRDHSRLLVLGKKNGNIEHKRFNDIVDYFKKGDILVLNNSKVFPARLIGKKKETKGKIEIFLHQKIRGSFWQCLVGGRGARVGLEVEFNRGLKCEIIKDNKDGTWEVKFNKRGSEFMKIVERIGLTPLPPYIKRETNNEKRITNSDYKNYQTVYADDRKVGSVAAPTAGFHFTPRLIKKLKNKGVQFEYVTLHVGLGTFAPVKVDNIKKHKMHAEYVEAKRKTIANIYLAKHEGRRVIAVGTTSVRVLEAIASEFSIFNFQFSNNNKFSNIQFNKQFNDFRKFVNIFIYPEYKFKIVDAMITNFHLPKSTLMMLVSAFAGKRNIDKAYKSAIKNRYRFYSYGDAMLIT